MKTLSAHPTRTPRPVRRAPAASVKVDQVRRFGAAGPAYIIRGVSGAVCRIEVPATGEKLSLPLAKVAADPLDR